MERVRTDKDVEQRLKTSELGSKGVLNASQVNEKKNKSKHNFMSEEDKSTIKALA